MVIRWEDPPLPAVTRPQVDAFAEALRTRPGEWALLDDAFPRTRHLGNDFYRHRDIQWRQIQNEDGTTKRVYGRTKAQP